jgi:hypothetical protein
MRGRVRKPGSDSTKVQLAPGALALLDQDLVARALFSLTP